MQVELIDPNEYSFEDLRFELALTIGKPLPGRTLRYWLREIGIERNDLGFYERSDLEILKLWIAVKPELRTIERFKALLRRNKHATK